MSATYESVQPIDPRAAATVTLLAVTLVAGLGMRLAVPAPTPSPRSTAGAVPVERVAAAPVKIIGASPRSEACDAQVWPYIEGRCLVRAPASAAPRAETTAAAAPAPAAARAEATGAAPHLPPRIALDDGARLRTAASHLRLPPRRAAASAASDAWVDDDVEQPAYGTQTRRAGRRNYNGERSWRRRHAFPFLFR